MAISRKPTKADSVDVEALIKRGGSVSPASTEADEANAMKVQLRIPKKIVSEIDRSLQTRPIRTPRHTWFLEAIHDKLASEMGSK